LIPFVFCSLLIVLWFFYFFFFFQAEDGIRDFHVTGVQTCALPISGRPRRARPARGPPPGPDSPPSHRTRRAGRRARSPRTLLGRSEERRVGKEGRHRGSPDH